MGGEENVRARVVGEPDSMTCVTTCSFESLEWLEGQHSCELVAFTDSKRLALTLSMKM